LNVNQTGMYNVYVDYGPSCTGSGNTDFNIVDVNIGGTEQYSINTPTKTSLLVLIPESISIRSTNAFLELINGIKRGSAHLGELLELSITVKLPIAGLKLITLLKLPYRRYAQ